MLDTLIRERSTYIPFNASSLSHIVHGAASLKHRFDDFINDASVMVYQKALDINYDAWTKIDKVRAIGLPSIALMTTIALAGCAGKESINSTVTADICQYSVTELQEGHAAKEGHPDYRIGNRKIILVNPLVVSGMVGPHSQKDSWFEAYYGDFPYLIEYAPIAESTPLIKPCERVEGTVIAHDDTGLWIRTDNNRLIKVAFIILQ